MSTDPAPPRAWLTSGLAATICTGRGDLADLLGCRL
jgi:hypothetical protein